MIQRNGAICRGLSCDAVLIGTRSWPLVVIVPITKCEQPKGKEGHDKNRDCREKNDAHNRTQFDLKRQRQTNRIYLAKCYIRSLRSLTCWNYSFLNSSEQLGKVHRDPPDFVLQRQCTPCSARRCCPHWNSATMQRSPDFDDL
jgi:hypothetical protein